MPDRPAKSLRSLARLHGVMTSYEDALGRRRVAGEEALLAMLKALGAPVDSAADVESALRERGHALRTRRAEPVVVAWGGAESRVTLRVPESRAGQRVSCVMAGEDGRERRWELTLNDLATTRAVESEGERVAVKRLPLPALEDGYHRLTLDGGGFDGDVVLVIAAPVRAYAGEARREWGVFCPPYAIRRESNWGAGDLGDLDALTGWVAGQGGGLVATLPMLATRFDPGRPTASPYAPSSRLFRNEFYLDIARIPEAEAVRELIDSPDLRRAIEEARRSELVDYGRQMALKRRVLEAMADKFHERDSPRREAFRRFVRERPEVESYAAFMAAGERFGAKTSGWPAEYRTPGGMGDVDGRAKHYHMFVQWLADEQVRTLATSARDRGVSWYVDFPVGVHPDGYDAWSRPGLFASGAAIGCPPDPFSTQGQDWQFPPVHPERQREEHYRYLIASLRRQLDAAGALRLDHAAGLHRLFWIPRGGDPKEQGAYVRYPAEELYAILSLESHRARAWLVGENLGTLPAGLNPGMERHGIRGMAVAQFELKPDPEGPLRVPPPETVASVNTHDMAPFASYWDALDTPDRVDLGLIDEEQAREERSSREEIRRAVVAFLVGRGLLEPGRDDAKTVLGAFLEHLGRSPAQALLVNVEDLWLETRPQNTPGTDVERPNWRRKLRLGFEEFSQSEEIAALLRRVDEARRASPSDGA